MRITDCCSCKNNNIMKISSANIHSFISFVADCPALTAPDDGTIDVPLDRQVSDIATYTCLGGYDLMGDATRECLPDNTWSGSEPTCQITRKSLKL